jgi:hypothetical protein
MAVRDDFAPGEVLAAADLNDTFASKQADVMTTKGDLAAYGTAVARLAVGTNGHVLTADSGETLGIKWAAPAVAGLTLISADSFSAVSAVNINNCFSATYQNYVVFVNCVGSTSLGIRIRMRASGSDASGNDYAQQFLKADGNTASAQRSTSQSQVTILDADTGRSTMWLTVGSPFEVATTVMRALNADSRANATIQDNVAVHGLSTSYDGFSLLTSSGTITGTVRVYGLKD